MKQSLRKAISLFSISEQAGLYACIVLKKNSFKIPEKFVSIFTECYIYVRLIEKNIDLVKGGNKLIRANFLLRDQNISIFLRRNSSDFDVFKSVILEEEYAIVIKETQKLSENPTIVDAGGNIGLTSIYFNVFYPQADFVIIEPDEKNFSILKMNIDANKFKKVIFLQKALWVASKKLEINNSFRDGKEWSLSVKEPVSDSENSHNSSLEGITLQDIRFQNKIDCIDILKIDIEGGEVSLFKNQEFLELINTKVSNMVIEIHDEFNIREYINDNMSRFKFSKIVDKDLTFYSKYQPGIRP